MVKKSNKTIYSGRRRSVTRKSGFKITNNFEGIKIKFTNSESVYLQTKEEFIVTFRLPKIINEKWVCFGLYYNPEQDLDIKIINPNYNKLTLENYGANCWSKIGSIWKATENQEEIKIKFFSKKENVISFAMLNCGIVDHEFLDINNNLWINRNQNKEERYQDFNNQLKNLYTYSPESNFIDYKYSGEFIVSKKLTLNKYKLVATKNCNRCGRFLPINLNKFERKTLSFSNHCGESKKRCTHKSFGIIKINNQDKHVQLKYGFQLECRFCKKFVVNAALNPQRTSSQLKEDGQRRRYFELLLTELYKKSPILSYRHQTGKELIEDIYEKFNKSCFKCKSQLVIKGEGNTMHLDHTRPLALLWQVDGSATALCKNCNTKKRDKPPSEFYTKKELSTLSEITGLSLMEINNPSPNENALKLLMESKEWFFNQFLNKKELLLEKDGKIAAELICKALDKVVSKSDHKYKFSFYQEYVKRFHLL